MFAPIYIWHPADSRQISPRPDRITVVIGTDSIVGRAGVERILEASMSYEEK
jgi:hypothetical protein